MNKKCFLGLILFAGLIITGLFVGANYLTQKSDFHNPVEDINQTTENSETSIELMQASEKNQSEATPEIAVIPSLAPDRNNQDKIDLKASVKTDEEDTLERTGSDADLEEGRTSDAESVNIEIPITEGEETKSKAAEEKAENKNAADEPDSEISKLSMEDASSSPDEAGQGNLTTEVMGPQLILDCTKIDYGAYIPDMVIDNELEAALDISNPDISVDAAAAILFDVETKKVIYHKNAVEARFSASTIKLLTSLIALKWCDDEEEVTIGDEITMIAPDSSKAYLKQGEVLSIHNLLAGMLLPSGNDAAYAVAAYVGRKALKNPEATKEEAIAEFSVLMKEEANSLGVKNSCFKTPDGYDAVGQYTTAYDMGLIGMAAAKNEVITEITEKATSRNVFPSGEDVTWESTNKLITRYSGQYYSPAIGLKTGTSTMAGRCLVAAAKKDNHLVVCVVMDSSSAGRWEDAIKMLRYGLER